MLNLQSAFVTRTSGRLLEARKREGRLSQEDLAQFLGTKEPAIGRYERDEMKLSIEVAAKMADYLEVLWITWWARRT